MYPKVGLIYEASLVRHVDHDSDHVENPKRITHIYQAIVNSGLEPLCTKLDGRAATTEEILLNHDQSYFDYLQEKLNGAPKKIYFSSNDMYGNQHTLKCALLAAGSTIELMTQIVNGKIDTGLALVRPPGHHAEAHSEMGFCFFNNVMIAAIKATQMGQRVLIVDWDVHFGNGSYHSMHGRQHDNTNLMFCSIHKYDQAHFYPSLPVARSCQELDDRVLNIAFDGAKGDDFYLTAFKEQLQPLAEKFQPDLILVSAGFDAAVGDPLGGCHVTPKGYYQLTRLLMNICPKVGLILEGGYNLKSISDSSLACLQACLKLEFKSK